ncbi:MAG: acyl-CoA carboxylase subunit beta, partial [Rhodococcus sp.]|nr:acyl-CoA carboxylase subunit beta [Rhodococcus sp. (in: high G+C Gram-positive bacteria)]
MTILAPVTRSGTSTDPRDPLTRLEKLFDAGTTVPLHDRDKSGILAASGEIDGVHTIAYCSDATVMGGAMGVDGCKHIVAAIDTAIEQRAPIVGVWHSGGARLAEGVEALHAVGLVFEAMVRASGLVPQISV